MFPAEKRFADRREAALLLSEHLAEYGARHPVILGIPRGGIVIADTIANELQTDLDVVLTRKLGAPGNPELAIGAVSEHGEVLIDPRIARAVGADDDYIEREKARQLAEIEKRRERYRSVLPKVLLQGRTAIIVDDGIATGATMRASARAARAEGAAEVAVAAPVGAPDSVEMLREEADQVVCLLVPEYLYAIGQFYLDFQQVNDEEVISILKAHSEKQTRTMESQV
ncbi:MAG: phosphoribosyl transferase [Planctomycetaceae bacterium]|nr:MAG: phosphoribosyl transferase [Planctomycetaceae bacterium]